MANKGSGEKTEKPTPKRRKELRKEGQVARTQEIGAWSATLVAALATPLLVGHELTRMSELLTTAFTSIPDASPATDLAMLGAAMRHAFIVLVALGAGIMVIGVAGALSQGGFYFATKAAKPKLSKLNPLNGAKRIFGPQAVWEGGKMLIKSSLVAIFVYTAIRGVLPMVSGFVPIPTVIDEVSTRALGMLRSVALAGLVMAGADYAMSRRRIGKQTKMTKDEVKQEHKQSEGDPMLKGAIRSRQLAASRNRMMSDVREADVVLVNPTHVAVALRYDAEKGAPRVVARGAGAIAAKIRAAAVEARVPMVRDIPLARALYTSSRVGQEIPAELFAAVAQVLAFVIKRRTLGQYGGQHRSPRGETALPETLPAGRRRRALPIAAKPSTGLHASR